MECRMPRTGACARDHRALSGGSQFAGRRIETENEHTVQALVRDDYEAAGGSNTT